MKSGEKVAREFIVEKLMNTVEDFAACAELLEEIKKPKQAETIREIINQIEQLALQVNPKTKG